MASYPSNLAKGQYSLSKKTSGINNTSVGNFSLYSLTTGNYNSCIGCNSEYYSTTGSNNTSIGYSSANNFITGSNNTFLGSQTGFNSSSNTYSNSTAVGYGAIINSSNQIVFGTLNEKSYIPNKVCIGINNKNSTYILDVSGSARFSAYNLNSITTIGSITVNNSAVINAQNTVFNKSVSIGNLLVMDGDILGTLTVPLGKMYNYPGGITYTTSTTMSDGLPSFYQVDISGTSTITITLPNATENIIGQVITFFNTNTNDNVISTQNSDLLFGVGILGTTSSYILANNYTCLIIQCSYVGRWLILTNDYQLTL